MHDIIKLQYCIAVVSMYASFARFFSNITAQNKIVGCYQFHYWYNACKTYTDLLNVPGGSPPVVVVAACSKAANE